MQPVPLRTTIVGSYPLPGWLQFANANLAAFGETDRTELYEDAVATAIHDQLAAGLDVISDGEQTRTDATLSFYQYLQGLELESDVPRRFAPPAQDQRPKHRILAPLTAPMGLGVVEEFKRLDRLCEKTAGRAERGNLLACSPLPSPPGEERAPATARAERRALPETVALKVSVPGPYTLSGGLFTNNVYPNRFAVTEGLVPIVRTELVNLVAAGCSEIMIDEPSMACYAHRDDPVRFVDILNRTIEPVIGKCRLSIHLCFGNYRGRSVGPRSYRCMFPAFMDLKFDEIHVEMANREFAELEMIGQIAKRHDVAVGIVDVKNYYIETPADIAERVRRCLTFVPAEKLALAPDCGLSQTARWAARQKLKNLVAGVREVRQSLSPVK